MTVEEAQARLNKWCTTRGDIRLRATADGRSTVQTLAELEPLRPVPAPYPVVLTVARVVSAQALVSYAGNRYSVPPELHGSTVTVSLLLGATHLDIATLPTPGRPGPVPTVIARHQLAPAGAGATIREVGHVTALTEAALAAFTTAAPHRRKERRPPSPAARAEAEQLRHQTTGRSSACDDTQVVVNLARYAAAAAGRNALIPAAPNPSPEDQPDTRKNTLKETNQQ
ncbi:hypothetical protein [Humibacillus sp. DSM 29435]|uniref:Mu transposase domain-containing protein n=1 Tax=Humibacillus sp. DSM 29435 TaxID=1869167 RepID=UPI001585E7A4|nr:hypothetical protein [Humibacillus sp. DSM 29435]